MKRATANWDIHIPYLDSKDGVQHVLLHSPGMIFFYSRTHISNFRIFLKVSNEGLTGLCRTLTVHMRYTEGFAVLRITVKHMWSIVRKVTLSHMQAMTARLMQFDLSVRYPLKESTNIFNMSTNKEDLSRLPGCAGLAEFHCVYDIRSNDLHCAL